MSNLAPKHQLLAAIACTEAKGDINSLSNLINTGLDKGLTVNEIKEALSQLYAYTGFPRSLNALGTLQAVIAQRKEAGIVDNEGKDASPLDNTYNALEQGTIVQTQLCSGKPFDYAFSPATDFYLKAHLFGDIFARDNLTHALRELVTVSALAGMEGVEPQLKAHVAGALNMGLSQDELEEISDVLCTYVGKLEAWRARKAISEVTGIPFNEGRPVDFNVWPLGVPNTGYAQYFTGASFLAPLQAEKGGPINVTFEPRCRNNWHIHHRQVQVLICVAGRGWYQEWEQEPVELKPGSVIAIPAEVKHWHGAAHDTWFQHLTYHTKVEEGASNEWLEAVTDDLYNKLK